MRPRFQKWSLGRVKTPPAFRQGGRVEVEGQAVVRSHAGSGFGDVSHGSASTTMEIVLYAAR